MDLWARLGGAGGAVPATSFSHPPRLQREVLNCTGSSSLGGRDAAKPSAGCCVLMPSLAPATQKNRTSLPSSWRGTCLRQKASFHQISLAFLAQWVLKWCCCRRNLWMCLTTVNWGCSSVEIYHPCHCSQKGVGWTDPEHRFSAAKSQD